LPAVAFLLWFGVALRGEPTCNTELVAVPTPGTVVVDGSLGDWDLSGSVFSCHDPATLRERCSAWSAAMYDQGGLYLSVRWADVTPLDNRVNPLRERDRGKGWRGDSLQIHLSTDQELHVTAWYFATSDTPAIDVHVGDLREPSRKAWDAALTATVSQAFRPGADRQGYVQELFLPWSVLRADGHAPEAGTEMRLGLQFNWGSSGSGSFPAHTFCDVVKDAEANRVTFWTDESAWGTLKFSAVGNLSASASPGPADEAAGIDAGRFELAYDLSAAGFVTIAIDDADGRRVRNLLGCVPRSAGGHVEHWDGRDDQGKAVPPGAFRWYGLFNPGLEASYRLHFYPHINPPWRVSPRKGGWGSDTGMPAWINGNRYYVFVLYDNADAGDAVMALSAYGTKLWGHCAGPGDGGTALGASTYHVFYGRDTIKRLDAYTGHPEPFETPTGELIPPFGEGKHLLTGMTAYSYRLYVASASANMILALSPTDGSLITRIPIEQPHGLALDSEYRLWAVSGKTVVVIPPSTLQKTVVVSEGLVEPRGLAVDREGKVYVADVAQQQVFAYSAEGRPLGAMGVEGGRPETGAWSRSAFYRPVAVVADRYESVWVAESDPLTKRISRWRGQKSCTSDYVGPGPYGGDGIVDSLNPARIYCGGMEFRVISTPATPLSPAKTQVYPAYVHMRPGSSANPVVSKFLRDGYRIRQGHTVRHGQNDYLLLDCGAVCIRREQAWVPCASIGNLDPDDGTGSPPRDQKLWSDLNADGAVQEEEVTVVPRGDHGTFDTVGPMGWGLRWRSDLTTLRRSRKEDTTFLLEFKPSMFTDQGVPVFDTTSMRVVRELGGTDGNAFCATDWGAVAVHQSPITGVDRDGNTRWTYPQPHYGVEHAMEAPLPVEPGTVIGSLYLMGTAHVNDDVGDVFVVNGYYGQRHVFTHDGLFVQSLFTDSRMLPERAGRLTTGTALSSLGDGAFGGSFTKSTDGRYYLTGMGAPGCVVLTVDRVDALKRLAGGTISVPAAE